MSILLVALFVLVALAMTPIPSLAAGKPKKAKAPVDALVVEALRLQKMVHELRDWEKQINRKKAFKTLASSNSVPGLYRRFENKLQGREIAWVIARKEVNRNLATEAHFIEHNMGKDASLKGMETNVRCYVDEGNATRAKAAPPGSMVLCIGKIADVQFFQNFISIGVESRNVVIGNDAFEAWVGKQAKLTK